LNDSDIDGEPVASRTVLGVDIVRVVLDDEDTLEEAAEDALDGFGFADPSIDDDEDGNGAAEFPDELMGKDLDVFSDLAAAADVSISSPPRWRARHKH